MLTLSLSLFFFFAKSHSYQFTSLIFLFYTRDSCGPNSFIISRIFNWISYFTWWYFYSGTPRGFIPERNTINNNGSLNFWTRIRIQIREDHATRHANVRSKMLSRRVHKNAFIFQYLACTGGYFSLFLSRSPAVKRHAGVSRAFALFNHLLPTRWRFYEEGTNDPAPPSPGQWRRTC